MLLARAVAIRLLLVVVLPLGGAGATAPGPDAFGYLVSPLAGIAVTNLSLGYPGNGSRRTLDFDDDAAVTVDIGFSFKFYGSNYTSVSLTPNGLMTFGGLNTAFSNVNLAVSVPGTNLPCIAVLWDDWETQSPGPADRGVYYRTDGSPGGRRFIVQWQHLQPIFDNDTVSFEAVLFESNNEILFSYIDVVVADNPSYGNGAFATIGIRDVDGHLRNRCLQWSYNQAAVSNGMNLLFMRTNQLRIASIQRLSDGNMRLQSKGVPFQSYILENCTNLMTWTTVTNQQADAAGAFDFVQPLGTNRGSGFYRLREP